MLSFVSFSRINKRLTLETIAVIVLWLLGLFLRLYQLDKVMPFTFDQGRDLLELAALSKGDITLVGPTTGIAGFFLGPFYFYALLPGFLLGGGSPVGVAYWVALIASVALPLSFYLAKKVTTPTGAWLTYLMLTFLPGSLHEARVIWNPSFAVPLLVASWWCLFESKKKSWLLIPALLLYGLSLQTELAYTVFLAPIYLWWVAIHSPLAQKFRQQSETFKGYSWPVLIASITAGVATLLPQLVFELKHSFIMTNAITTALFSSEKSISYAQVWQDRPRFIATALQEMLFSTADGTVWLLIGLFVALAVVAHRWRTVEQRFVIMATCLPIIGMLLFKGNNGNFFAYYLNPHYLPLVLAATMLIQHIPYVWGKRLYGAFLLLVVGVAFALTAHIIYNPHILQYTYSRQLEAYLFARSQTTSQPPTLEIFVPNLRPTQYHYLDQWYAKANNLTPAQINQNLTGDQTVILLYEPGFRGGSLSAFRSWYKERRLDSECSNETTFGILTVENCYRLIK